MNKILKILLLEHSYDNSLTIKALVQDKCKDYMNYQQNYSEGTAK